MRMVGIELMSVVALMGGLILLNDSALAGGMPSDTMAHFGDIACTNHTPLINPMVNPTTIQPNPTFSLCRRNSGATFWSATIVKNTVPPQTLCTLTYQQVPGNGIQSFSCPNVTTSGLYKGTITYYVENSPLTQIDQYWRIP